MEKSRKETLVFAAFLLLAGIFHIMEGYPVPTLIAMLTFCATTVIYAGLILVWVQSVYNRLLPSRARSYILASAMLFLFYLILRTFKYRIVPPHHVAIRLCWYGYYLPLLLVPTLFLLCGIRILMQHRQTRPDERILLIPPILLFVGIMTNEFHHQAFAPAEGITGFWEPVGTYEYGVLFFAAYFWAGLCIVAGVVVLIAASRRMTDWRSGAAPLLFLAALVFLLVLQEYLNQYNLPDPYRIPEIEIFCTMGIFEACIRKRLVPYNENYIGFFSGMTIPAVIADRMLVSVYTTAAPLKSGSAWLRQAEEKPVYPDPQTRLSGMKISAGYAFYEEDISELVRMNEQLASVNEILNGENALIRAEREAEENKARLDAQNRIYDQIAEVLYPSQKKIAALLDSAVPGDRAFLPALAKCLVLNAYCKRRSNLILLSEQTVPAENRELYLALQESCRYLGCCGIEAAAAGREYTSFPLDVLCDLYDTFEAVVETFLPVMKRLIVSPTEQGLKLMLEAEVVPALPEMKLPASIREADGYLYITVSAGEEGADEIIL